MLSKPLPAWYYACADSLARPVVTQEEDDLPLDWPRLYDDTPYALNFDLLPHALQLYEQLGIKKAPLSLIPPQFDAPTPPLQLAVFPAILPELPPLPLELFDLDVDLASPQVSKQQ